jgi:hypothetical protein
MLVVPANAAVLSKQQAKADLTHNKLQNYNKSSALISMAATKISRFFIFFYGAPSQQDRRLQRKRNKNDNRPIYQAGAHQRPQLLPIKGAHEIG